MWLSEPNYKFRLSAFQDRLLQWLDDNPTAVTPRSRFNEVRASISAGLTDLSVSRLQSNVQWGLPVPSDADGEPHSIYVWLDALSNYLTVAGGMPPSAAWPADVQVIGKDIIRFHCVYWPAFLMAAGLPPPTRVVAHSHWTVNKVKMSKSLGNVVDPLQLLDTYSVDAIRYFLLREGGMADDGDFSEAALLSRYTSDLADVMGNLGARVRVVLCTCPAHPPSRVGARGCAPDSIPVYGCVVVAGAGRPRTRRVFRRRRRLHRGSDARRRCCCGVLRKR